MVKLFDLGCLIFSECRPVGARGPLEGVARTLRRI